MLLLCTLLGLALMHTIGHSAMSHSPHADHHHASTANAPVMTETDHCAGDGCSHEFMLLNTVGGGMVEWDLCIAVLSAFAVAVLLALLLMTAVTGRFPPRRGRGRHITAPRGPPLTPFGLTLAAMSVLRT